MTPALAEVQKLVEEISGGLAGDAGEVTFACRASFVPVTGRAGLHPLFDGIERGIAGGGLFRLGYVGGVHGTGASESEKEE
jgi:hypothetical protein